MSELRFMLSKDKQKYYDRLSGADKESLEKEYPRVSLENGALVSIPEDEYWLAKMIFWEARDAKLDDKAREAVGWVARNRRENPFGKWGTTYQDVVTDPGQFSPYLARDTNDSLLIKEIQKNPTEKKAWDNCIRIAKDVVNAPESSNPLPDIFYFHSPNAYNGPVRYQSWMLDMDIVRVEGIDPCDFEFFR